MEQKKCACPHCAKRATEDAENDEMSFAVLLAMVPLMVMTVFGSMGLF